MKIGIPETDEIRDLPTNRVTGLGEFSPLGRLFTFGSFFLGDCLLLAVSLKIMCMYNGIPNLGRFFPLLKLRNNFDKTELGYILGHFLKNSSSRPAYKQLERYPMDIHSTNIICRAVHACQSEK
jgi:hypothetical protein